MARFSGLVTCLLLLQAAPVPADNIEMIGAGKVTCTEWKSLRESNEYFSAGNWVLGFLSGSAWDSGRNILSGQQPSKLFVFIDNYCEPHKQETISDAAVALAYFLLGTEQPE